eukprot:jgi/Mesen1/4968/ME000248S04252
MSLVSNELVLLKHHLRGGLMSSLAHNFSYLTVSTHGSKSRTKGLASPRLVLSPSRLIFREKAFRANLVVQQKVSYLAHSQRLSSSSRLFADESKLSLLARKRLVRPRAQACITQSAIVQSEEIERMATEEAVGISCNTNDHPGFRGVLKQRFTDFLVNEVDRDGNIVHLTTLKPPPQPMAAAEDQVASLLPPDFGRARKGEVPAEPSSEEQSASPSANEALLAAAMAEFSKLASEGEVAKVRAFLEQVGRGEGESLKPLLLEPDTDKVHRAATHNFFKAHAPFLVSDTVDEGPFGEKCIRLRFYPHITGQGRGGGGGANRRDNRAGKGQKRGRDGGGAGEWRAPSSWPADRGKFLQFHMYKENKDTQDALNVIGRALNLQVTVFRQTAERLAGLNKRLYGVKVGDFKYVDENLVLGQLGGNHFVITLRGVEAPSESVIAQAAEGLKASGFINYFGLQRFGSGNVGTHEVGKCLLRGKWQAAINLILSPREGDILLLLLRRRRILLLIFPSSPLLFPCALTAVPPADDKNRSLRPCCPATLLRRCMALTRKGSQAPDVAEARQLWRDTADPNLALARMPNFLVAERSILMGLSANPSSLVGALARIPRTMRMLYVHSYQSYLWNHAASHRIRKYGSTSVVEGDLVLVKDEEPRHEGAPGGGGPPQASTSVAPGLARTPQEA